MRVTKLGVVAVAAVALVGLAAGIDAAVLPARAAGSVTVSVTALDREGKAVSATAALESADSLAVFDSVAAGQSVQVPPGSYNIAAWVPEPNGMATTLVDQPLTVTSSPVPVVLDARGGQPVKFTVNDSTVRTDEIAVVPYSSRAGWSALAATGGDLPVQGKTVYAVPGPLPTGWKVGFQADLTRRPGGPSPVEYDLVRVFSGAIPASLTFATSKASLALDHVTIRAVEPHETDGLGLGPFIPGSPGDAANPFELDVFGQISSAPYAVDLYLTPGYQWGLLAQSDVNQALVVTGKLLGGHVYANSLNQAAFGPGPLLGLSVLGGQLRLDPAFGQDLLTDPDGPTSQSFGFPVGLNVTGPQAWIYRGSTLLTHGTGWGSTITAPVSSTPQWYTLRLQGSRYSVVTRGPATGLAAKVTASFTFQTEADDGSLPGAVFWPRVAPRGLSATNAAAHGSKTAVPFTFATTAGVIAVHGVKAWASVNGGKTWTALAVASSSGGRSWTATVTNPARPGWVSLRVQGTSAAGFTASVTAINAYGVS